MFCLEERAMEGSAVVAVRRLGVEHDFECSRLEQALLARAYQQVVPSIRRRIGGREIETRASATRTYTLAKGG
jgi:hypothetical protein